MLRSEIRTELRQLLNDTASIKFGDTQLNDWIDLANQDAIARLGPFDRKMATVSTVKDEPNYGVPTRTGPAGSDCVSIIEVYLADSSDNENHLEIITQAELVARYGVGWRNDDAGAPAVAYLADYNVLGLHPKPDSDNASRTLRTYYWGIPSDFSGDTDYPIFMQALQYCLVWFCVHLGKFQLGNLKEADYAQKQYERLIRTFYSTVRKGADELMCFRWDVSNAND